MLPKDEDGGRRFGYGRDGGSYSGNGAIPIRRMEEGIIPSVKVCSGRGGCRQLREYYAGVGEEGGVKNGGNTMIFIRLISHMISLRVRSEFVAQVWNNMV